MISNGAVGRSVWILVVVALLMGTIGAAEEPDLTAVDTAKIAKSAAAGLVRVEYTLRFDKGESPVVAGWGKRCPYCGEIHSVGDGSEFVEQERPLEIPGYVIGPREVIAPDMMIHPRFVEKIEVAFGDTKTAATIKTLFRRKSVAVLELAAPLEGTKVFDFKPGLKEPFVLVMYDEENGRWNTTVKPLSTAAVSLYSDGKAERAPGTFGVVMTQDLAAAGMCTNSAWPADDSWQGSPLNWAGLSAMEYRGLTEKIGQAAEGQLLRVKLNFRSPKSRSRMSSYSRYMSEDEEGAEATEIDTVGVAIAPQRVMILSNLRPKNTARLERITVFDRNGKSVQAKFAGTLSDYGALIVETAEPVGEPVVLAGEPITGLLEQLLTAVDVRVQGNQRIQYVGHRRIAKVDVGWRKQLYPAEQVTRNSEETGTGGVFLFDEQGRLVTLPIQRRKKVREDQDVYSSDQPSSTAAGYLKDLVAEPVKFCDASNVPLDEAKENRIAWIGVEMQRLDRELARLHKVSDLTQDGRTGTMVSYVYPDSPAAKAGIQAGAILLRLKIPGRSKPVDIKTEENGSFEEFPWDQLNEIPEQYFDEIPYPWPNAENPFARTISDIGFGKTYTVVYVQDSKQAEKEFTVEESPAHYDSAARYKSELLGLTVRDLTYEVRRFFQKQPEEPGVIVSKIEPGSKASVGGIKPFEIVTHVNDQPIATVKDFERLIAGGQELRFAVKRMTKGRVVRIKLDGSAAGPTAKESPILSAVKDMLKGAAVSEPNKP